MLICCCGLPAAPSDFRQRLAHCSRPRKTNCSSAPLSLWETAIKRGLGRNDFQVDARVLRRGLLDNGYNELPITSEHSVAIDTLPPIHKDPFDRILVAQAMVEGIILLTADALVARYPGPVRLA
ncbi:type II toxin-antitoxin system VapC family toxin [Azotobacter chroococcum]|uniref:type II toxin-antitoxin system VapC family toxin n=1 Tax=Azotobacter chroococcum TaxID=353 RepID=UPI0030B83B98